MNSAQAMLDLQRIKQQYSNTVLQLTTGEQNVNIGDNPTASAEAMNYQDTIDLNNQYVAQGATAANQLSSTSTVLSSMISDITQVLGLATNGLGSSTDPTAQAADGTQVDAIRTALIALGNTEQNGTYLFSGTATTTVPFTNDTSTTPNSVTYNGNSGIISLNVGASTTIATNIPGNSLFFGPSGQGSATDLMAQVTAVRDALTSGNTAALQTATNNLTTISQRIEQAQTAVGGLQNSVSTLQNGMNDFTTNLQAQQSTLEAVDYPTAITNLNQESVAEQASLNAMSMANTKNLFDYIG
jgi:flagellar hook-associated protein 3 FlgL